MTVSEVRTNGSGEYIISLDYSSGKKVRQESEKMSRGEGRKSTSSPKESKKSSSNSGGGGGVRERGKVRPIAGSPRPLNSSSQPQLAKKEVGISIWMN